MKIILSSWEQVQEHIIEHQLPFASTLTKVVIALLNLHIQKNQKITSITMHQCIVPKAYFRNPSMWADQISKSTSYPVVQGFKSKHDRDCIVIRGGQSKIKPCFLSNLRDELLKGSGRVVCRSANIPLSYQTQPFVILTKLRKTGVEARILHHDDERIIYQIVK